jgi:hypothetical protein
MLRSDDREHTNAVITPVDDLITVQYDVVRSQDCAHRYRSVRNGDSTDDTIDISPVAESPAKMQPSLVVPTERPRADTGSSRRTSGTFLTVDDAIAHATEVRRASTSGEQSEPFNPNPSASASVMPSPAIDLHRRPSMAQYERSLTLLGDDRRRPSAIKLKNLQDYQEAINHDLAIKPASMSRQEIEDEEDEDLDPLMANALKRHQQGKALFQSASKRRESMLAMNSSPTLPNLVSLDLGGRSSSTNALLTVRRDSLDLAPDSFRRVGSNPYTASEIARPADFLNPGLPLQIDTNLKESIPSVFVKSSSASPNLSPKAAKIGTSLPSWSRFASHTRSERCGSATIADLVTPRDFAEQNVDTSNDSVEPASPASKKSTITYDSKNGESSLVIKRRSMTIGSIVKYYHNLLSTGGTEFSGQNRRTSVAVGGKLKQPELEMLSPSTVVENRSDSLHKHLKQVEDSMENFAETVIRHAPKHEHSQSSLFHRCGKEGIPHMTGLPAGSIQFRLGSMFDEPAHNVRRMDTSVDPSAFDMQRMDTNMDPPALGSRRINIGMGPSDTDQPDESDSPDSLASRQDSANTNEIPGLVISQIDGASACIGEDSKSRLMSSKSHGALTTSSPSSRAEIWSQMYKSCMTRHAPAFSSVSESANDHAVVNSSPKSKFAVNGHRRSQSSSELPSTPVPILKPLKARSPG